MRFIYGFEIIASCRIDACPLLCRDTVQKRAVDAVCATYKTLFDAIVEENNKYPDVKTLVPRTPDQVTSLLT